MRVLDIGCGPGGLTRVLAARVGADRVAAIDPAPQFAQACRQRNPGADVRIGTAEDLPWPAGLFDAALSCLVFGFFHDHERAVAEMIRVTRPGGVVAACMWDIADGGMSMLRVFWQAMRTVDPDSAGEGALPGTRRGQIAEQWRRGGLVDVTDGLLGTRATYDGFAGFWEPFTLGIGPAGQALAALPAAKRDAVREACRAVLPTGQFTLDARAWYATGRRPVRGSAT
jgi:SAM-dependent methyltransferase